MKFTLEQGAYRQVSEPANRERRIATGGKRGFSANGGGGFAAAEMTRLNSDERISLLSADNEIFLGLRVMRGRSRRLCMSEPYSVGFKRKVIENVIGPHGMSFQNGAMQTDGTFDLAANTKIKEGWTDWGRMKNCTVTKRQTWFDVQQLVVGSFVQDGELFLRKIRNFDNEFKFALQLLEADHFDETLMVASGYGQLPGGYRLTPGNRIVMGVEINEWREPVAYWYRKRHPGDIFQPNSSWTYERIDASEIIHVYLQSRPEQTRGIPWMFAAINSLNMIGAYAEAELVAARLGASKQGFFKPKTSDDDKFEPDDIEDGELIGEASPGQFDLLPAGLDFQEYNPMHPNQNFPGFLKALLRGVGVGIGIAYPSLANDLEGVNFSSIRAGTLEERDHWMVIQKFFAQHCAEQIFEPWLEMAIMSGKVSLPLSKFDKFHQPKFTGRRWPWVDPHNDALAAQTIVGMRWNTNEAVAESLGVHNWASKVVPELAAEEELLEQNELTQLYPSAITAPDANNGGTPKDDPGQSAGQSEPPAKKGK